MSFFRTIGARILVVVGTVVVVGLSLVIMLYAVRQEKSILEQNDRAIVKVTQSVSEGLQAVMLKGYADIGHDMAARLKKMEGVIDYRMLRMDGREAFIDNDTIDVVNARVGYTKFKRRPEALSPVVMPADAPQWSALLSSRTRQLFYETQSNGERWVTVLEPIRHESGCHDCHDDGQALRGVVKLTVTLSRVDADIRSTWLVSIGVVGAGLLLIFSAVYLVARQSVVAPIRRVTAAMAVAARGDMSVSVPVESRDEIGQMAQSFNQMSARLMAVYGELQDEQNKLTTIILGAREGIVVTDSKGLIVLANLAVSELLGKSENRIRDEGFLRLLDDENWMREQLAKGHEAEVSLIEYNGRTLEVHASTILAEGGRIIGSAAMLRDVTEERRLQAELQRLAHTDPLTALGNRRRFNEALDSEFLRAVRYKTTFSLLMLDIDHFKSVNDRFGHDFGDKVLQRVAKRIESAVRQSGIVCRFGGEELAVILPDLSMPEAQTIGETIRLGIEQLQIEEFGVTVSVGVAEFRADMVDGVEVLEAADAALYRAKEGGRNRVERADAY